MRITFLGTNGWYDTHTGNTCSVLVEGKDGIFVIDAGNGFAKLDQYIPSDIPVPLFISHFHLDHICGLHVLFKFRFTKGVHIYGQEGTRDLLAAIIREPYTVPFSRLPFPVTITELGEGRHTDPFPLEVLPLYHPSPCTGFRFEREGKAIAYCADTGYCENAVSLARGADLVIAESALLPGRGGIGLPHMSPEDAIRIAREAGARRLALIHFDAAQYGDPAIRRGLASRFAAEWPGLIIASDDMCIDL